MIRTPRSLAGSSQSRRKRERKGGRPLVDWSPVHLSIIDGSPKVVKLLLERGADIHAMNGEGETPYQVSLRGGKCEISDLLQKIPNYLYSILPFISWWGKSKIRVRVWGFTCPYLLGKRGIVGHAHQIGWRASKFNALIRKTALS
jgi:Ankyrin repeats (many copies)